ncbi:MAG TPA: hypothetical protein VKP08_20415 [Anaerolineales bacterium]|nr:hypothetical protein [Anaerolineales bacterium]
MKFHNRQRRYLLGWTISLLLVSSCSFKVERLDQPLATLLPSATLPASTNTPTPMPTVESTSTPTAQANTEVAFEQECIPVEERMPDDLILSGIWIRNRGKPYLEPMEGGTAYGVPLKGGGIFSTSQGDTALSPDGRYLAYIDTYMDDIGKSTRSRVLRIMNSSGRPLPMSYWIINWQWLIGWLDNQHLAIFTGNKEILVLEPFTGKWERLKKPAWLDRIEYDYSGNDGPFYSPTLNRILVKPDYSTFELKDFQTGQTIYKGAGDPKGWELDWSADGSTLAVSLGNLLNVVTGDRQDIELDASEFGIDRFDNPKLSSDGRKLAFTSHWSGKWFLFDIEQLQIRKLCSDEFDYWENAVWSPDGRFVVQEVDSSNSGQLDLLIDTQQLRAYKLPSGQYQHRLVWLAEP